MTLNTRKSIPQKQRYYILARDSFTCQYCGRSAPEVELHIDHIVPVARGGSNENINLLAACADCNQSKQADLLPPALIETKQMDIKQRTELYDAFLNKQPEITKPEPTHLHERPTQLLKDYSSLIEPLKGKSLHPDKRHVIAVTVDDEFNTSLEYTRLDGSRWTLVDLNEDNRRLRPMTATHYQAIIKELSFEVLDKVSEFGHSIRALHDDSGLYLIDVEIGNERRVYAFWSPIKTLELSLTIDSTEHWAVPSGEEEMFWDNWLD